MFDLRQIVWTVGVVLGAVSLYGGVRLLVRGAIAAAEQRGSSLGIAARRSNARSGVVLVILGAGIIVLVAMATIGPWREREKASFPMHGLDLSAPPAAIERAAPHPVPQPVAGDDRSGR